MSKIRAYALIGLFGLVLAWLLRQRRRRIPTPPPLTFLFDNPIVEAFAGSELLVERLRIAPGMRVVDAGCGPGRLTVPLAKGVGPTGEVVALDSQRAMLEKLESRLAGENITNVRTLQAGLGEEALEREIFDRALLAFVLGEVRDRGAAERELYSALKPGGILSVTEGFGDPDYRRPASVRREVEPSGFELVERFGSFPVYTLNFRKPENPAGNSLRQRRPSCLCTLESGDEPAKSPGIKDLKHPQCTVHQPTVSQRPSPRPADQATRR